MGVGSNPTPYIVSFVISQIDRNVSFVISQIDMNVSFAISKIEMNVSFADFLYLRLITKEKSDRISITIRMLKWSEASGTILRNFSLLKLSILVH